MTDYLEGETVTDIPRSFYQDTERTGNEEDISLVDALGKTFGWFEDNPSSSVSLPGELFVEMLEALQFYADPYQYAAIVFIGDPPCGGFIHDFSETEFGERPGKRARALLRLLAEKASTEERDDVSST